MGVPEIYNLDHLGLVAGLTDQLELVEQINEHVGEDPYEKVSPGVVVKAMILNGLGVLSALLYLFSRFFEGKPIAHYWAKTSDLKTSTMTAWVGF